MLRGVSHIARKVGLSRSYVSRQLLGERPLRPDVAAAMAELERERFRAAADRLTADALKRGDTVLAARLMDRPVGRPIPEEDQT